jgi:hypothetical protein
MGSTLISELVGRGRAAAWMTDDRGFIDVGGSGLGPGPGAMRESKIAFGESQVNGMFRELACQEVLNFWSKTAKVVPASLAPQQFSLSDEFEQQATTGLEIFRNRSESARQG